jgi:hypothetical protein
MIAVLAIAIVMSAAPVAAQTAPDSTRETQLALAGRYLELTQGGDLLKQMRGQIEDNYGETDLPAEQRAWLVEHLGALFTDVLQATITEMRDDVADRFTASELEAAVVFYESPLGRSLVRKQVDLNGDFQRAMIPLLMPRITELGEKFCLRFDCAAGPGAMAKQGR